MKPNEIIRQFDAYLAAKGLSFEAVVIGGAALNLLGTINRETVNCDVLDPTITAAIAQAAQDFCTRTSGHAADWLNVGPESLKRDLPSGWRKRLQPLFAGKALTLDTLGRRDLLKTKLCAYCDRGTDLSDCIVLKPTQAELDESIEWVQAQDANPLWPAHVRFQFEFLAQRLGYGT